MKNTRIIATFAALFAIGLVFIAVLRAAEQAQTDEQAKAILITGAWWFKGTNWGNFRTFHADGTFHARHDGTWKIADGVVSLIFPDHIDKLFLPIDPKGTKGMDSNGLPLMAFQTAVGAPPPTPVPVIAANFASVPPAIKAMLTQGQWYIQGMTWAAVREFKPDGTFTTQRLPGENGSWTVDKGAVLLTYISSAQDKILLPLNPKGSKGVDSKGNRMLAIQQPLVEPTPAPVPPKEITPAMIEAGKESEQSDLEISGLLTEGQWWFQGRSWANVRVFNADGTFKGGGDGTWKVDNGMVIIDSHGHQDNFILPVDPDGTNGIDSKGNPMIARRQPLKQAPPGMAAVTTPNTSAQTDAMVASVLVQGQWYFQGLSWANTRVFLPDGTFQTQQRPGEGGTWRIIDGFVVLTFRNSEQLLMLPIDPKFTIGRDEEGIPSIVFQQPLSGPAPTPITGPVRTPRSQITSTVPGPATIPALATPRRTPRGSVFGSQNAPDVPVPAQ